MWSFQIQSSSTEPSFKICQVSWSVITFSSLLSLFLPDIQSQHFNYTWMRHVRQQDLCVAPRGKGNGFALELCDNTKAELRWFHKSSNSLVGWLWVCCLLCQLSFVMLSFLYSVILVSIGLSKQAKPAYLIGDEKGFCQWRGPRDLSLTREAQIQSSLKHRIVKMWMLQGGGSQTFSVMPPLWRRKKIPSLPAPTRL